MKRTISLMAVLAMTACAAPEPIMDYNAPYSGKGAAPEVVRSPVPTPRPEQGQLRWLACPEALWNDDCDSGGRNGTPARMDVDTPAGPPVLDVDPDRPVGPDRPVPEQPAPEPDRPVDPGPDTPAPVDPEPETPVGPEPETPKGNNGVGNGEDPQPPGNPPVNDGPGTGPGNPGNKGGPKH